jgi:O-antigen ligase
MAAALVFVGLVWLVAQRSVSVEGGRRAVPLTRAAWFVAGATLLSVLTSQRLTTSLAEWARLVSIVMMLTVLERLFSAKPAAVQRVLVAVYASALVPCGVAIAQRLTRSGLTEAHGIPRVHGTFGQPNSLAMYLAFLIVMGVALLPTTQRWWRWGLAGVLVLSTGVLYLTQTRSAWIGTALGLLVVVWLRSRRLFIAAVVLIGAVALLPPVMARFADLTQGTRPSGGTGNSLTWRHDHGRDSLALADGRPVTGIGMKMVELDTNDGKLPHNDYLRSYVETGGLGLLAYLGLLGTILYVARKALRRAAGGLDRGVAVGFAGCALALLVISVSDNLMTQSVVLWYFAVFAAAASAVGSAPVARREEATSA